MLKNIIAKLTNQRNPATDARLDAIEATIEEYDAQLDALWAEWQRLEDAWNYALNNNARALARLCEEHGREVEQKALLIYHLIDKYLEEYDTLLG